MLFTKPELIGEGVAVRIVSPMRRDISQKRM
jgi:hypothetical protein